jgi:hypothetical protein
VCAEKRGRMNVCVYGKFQKRIRETQRVRETNSKKWVKEREREVKKNELEGTFFA